MELMNDFVFCLFDNDVQPDTQIGGYSVHQTEVRNRFRFAVDSHLYKNRFQRIFSNKAEKLTLALRNIKYI